MTPSSPPPDASPAAARRTSAVARLFLIGFMGTGKSTVGRLVAARLGWRFRDLDEEIVEAAGGASVARLFATEGEAGFRAREAAALARVAELDQVVVATGGGAACREDNLTLMLGSGLVVALEAPPEESVRRTGGASGRPLLDAQADPVGAAVALLAARQPYYARAHIRIDTAGQPPDDIAAAVLNAVASA